MLDLLHVFSDTKFVYTDFDNEKQVLSHPKDKYRINDFAYQNQ